MTDSTDAVLALAASAADRVHDEVTGSGRSSLPLSGAFHEAGHAVVAHVLRCRVVAINLTDDGAQVLWRPRLNVARDFQMRWGPDGVEMVLGSPAQRARVELAVGIAGELAQQMYDGIFGVPFVMNAVDDAIFEEALDTLGGSPRARRHHEGVAINRAARILRRHWGRVERIAAAIHAQRSLDQDELRSLLRNRR